MGRLEGEAFGAQNGCEEGRPSGELPLKILGNGFWICDDRGDPLESPTADPDADAWLLKDIPVPVCR
jgi:hypothetical protein